MSSGFCEELVDRQMFGKPAFVRSWWDEFNVSKLLAWKLIPESRLEAFYLSRL